MDYKFRRKGQWRREVWKELAKRVARPSRATVLYLASDQDLDRAVAINNGFSPAGLIAVESDSEKVAALRAKGVTTIAGRLEDVLRAWPDNWPVDAVLADFISGMEPYVTEALSAWRGRLAFSRSAMVVNLQRGRDKVSWMGHRAITGRLGYQDEFLRYVAERYEVPLTSRALDLIHWDTLRDTQFVIDVAEQHSDESGMVVTGESVSALLRALHRKRGGDEVVFRPYRSASGRVWMDSVLFSQKWVAGAAARRPASEDSLSRAIIAARAITTRRMRGELGGGRRA